MTNIFISYSHVDKKITERLSELLKKSYDVWYDTELTGGDKWWAKILEKIEWCNHFILLLSPESVNSEWCIKELDRAIEIHKHIIPVRIRDRTSIPPNLKDVHYIDSFSEITVDGLNEIYASIIRYENPSTISGSDIKKQDDLTLANKLWPYIVSARIRRLWDFVQGSPIQCEFLENLLDQYLNGLRSIPENHFHNQTLEEHFTDFDNILMVFFADTNEFIRSDNNVCRVVYPLTFNEKEEERVSNLLLTVTQQLIQKHEGLAKFIKSTYPGFDFSPNLPKNI